MPKSSSRSARRGGDTTREKSLKKKSTSRKRDDNSDLNVGQSFGLAKKVVRKSRNKKLPRSGSNKNKKRQVFNNKNDFQSNTYQGDIR